MIMINNIVTYSKMQPVMCDKRQIYLNERTTFTGINKRPLDIKARGKFPANVLSNFADTDFMFDGFKIKSIEGFLQALKTPDKNKQTEICRMNGFDAKNTSKSLKQNKNEMLMFWKNKVYRKESNEFRNLLQKVVETSRQNPQYDNFMFEGEKINSVNSFLQGAISEDAFIRQQIIQEPIEIALERAKLIKPQYDYRELHWNGKHFKRDSIDYQSLLTRIFDARYENDLKFRQAIRVSKKYELFHSKGKNNPRETILTIDEFLAQIKRLQNRNNTLQQIQDDLITYFKKLKNIYLK